MHGSRVRSSSSGVAMTSPRPHPLARGPRPALSCGPYSVTFSLTNLAQPARATYIVGTTTDHAGRLTSAATCRTAGNTTCALRDALIYATSGTDTIVFRNEIGAAITIVGANGPLMVGANMTITGPGAALLAIDGGVTVFTVNSEVTATIGGLTIQHGNASGADGGGIANGGTLTVTNSTLSSNTAGGGKGGGIFNSGTLTVTNSTLRSNGAVSGGGIRNTGTLALTNATLSGNTGDAIGDSGGILNGGTVTLTNTIVAGNTTFHSGPDLLGTIATGGHNLFGTTSGATITLGPGDLVNPTPLLGPLGSFGGPTQTIPLLAGSPAIDAGSDAVCAGATVGNKDQRGITRPFGVHCDIGAFEYQVVNPLPPAPNPLPAARPAAASGGPTPNPLPVPRR